MKCICINVRRKGETILPKLMQNGATLLTINDVAMMRRRRRIHPVQENSRYWHAAQDSFNEKRLRTRRPNLTAPLVLRIDADLTSVELSY